MDSASRQRARQIFDEVAELSLPERDAAILRLCGDEPDIAAEVRALLAAAPSSDLVMDALTVDPTVSVESPPAVTLDYSRADESPGSRIGPYRLVRQIGEGGFGSVFLAEQESPVRRTVALKIIKLGMDTRQIVARFEQERQALAMMNHPNIAKVFDAGATSSGRPYFVMELCKGQPITHYCDKNNLSITERLALFAQVCHAVQHAHQKGLIHRDIKPSNVLVSTEDGRPSAKVIDFGIAKATAGKLTEKTLFTEHSQMIGTPEYMSPEQAEGSLDIDTRTDVYALGVLLYELLTGSTPFDSRSLRSAAYAEIQRIIRDVEPPRPSTRLSQNADTVASVAANRHTEPGKLGTIIRGELDWIAMKALEKDRQRRYESASGLGLDIQRYLNGEPVAAAPPSRVYRCRKFIRRNKGPVIAASLLTAAMVAGLAGTSYGLRQAVKARDGEALAKVAALREADRAVKAEAETNARAVELKMVADFQGQMLAQIDPASAGAKLTEDARARFASALASAKVPDDQRSAQQEAFANLWSRVNATDLSMDLIDNTILKPAVAAVEKQFADQPIVACDLRAVLARRYHDLGIDATALALEQQTLAQRRRVLGDEHPSTLLSLGNVGSSLSALGRNNEAEPYFRDALDRTRRVRGNDAPETFTCLAKMASLYQNAGKLDEAERCFREALNGRRRVLGETHVDTIYSLNDLGELLTAQGKLAEAEACLGDVLAKSRNSFGEDGPSTLRATNDLAAVLQKQGKLDEAATYLRQLVKARRRLLGEVHPVTLNSIQNLGTVLSSSGRFDEAEVLLREAVTKQKQILGTDHFSTLFSMSNLAMLLIRQNKLAEAEPICRETLERRRRVLGEDHANTLTSINILGLVLRRQNKDAEAEPYIREMVSIGRRTLGPAHPDTLIYVHNLAQFLSEHGKLDEAAALFKEVVQLGAPSIGNGHPTVLSATLNLGGILLDQDHDADAAALLSAAEPFARKAFTGTGRSELAEFLLLLGRAQYRTARHAAAESSVLEAYDIDLKTLGADDGETRYCAEVIVQFYTSWDKADPQKGHDIKAAEWSATLKKLRAATQPDARPPSTLPAPPTE